VESDEDLMVRVQAGDEQALASLMGRWKSPLYGFLSRRADPDAADDLFQETWLRLVRARQRFDPRRRFSTWLFQIANNLCRDRWRRRSVERRALQAVREHAEVLARPAPGPDEPVERSERRGRVLASLDALPERLREVLVLRYYQELSEKEIASVLGIPRGTVKSRLHAAANALRAAAGPLEGSDAG